MDELIGIPTYEQVGAMPPASITDGEFITDDRYDSGQQIFAASEEGLSAANAGSASATAF